jgi:probable HAF family extracellular repeat protein
MHTQLLRWAESCVGISAARCRIPLAISVAIATLSLNVTVLCAQTYTLTDIGTLGGSESNGGGINSSGQVTGASTIAGSSLPHAFVYTPGVSPTMIDIMPAAPNTLSSSWGASINDAGQVTGVWNETAFVYLPRPFSLMVPLPMPLHTGQSYGTSINNSGQIVGYYCAIGFLGGCEHTVFLFNSGAPSAVIQALATPGSGYGAGFGINDAGQITGLFYTSDSSTSQTHAFLSNPSHVAGASPTMSDLGTLPNGSYAEGFAINSFGQVTGWAGISNTSAAGHAFLYSNGSPIYSTPGIIDLGTPPGGGTSLGMGINNLDQVTGWFLTDTDAHRAFLFINNGMSDLNSLIDPSTPLPANVTLVQGDAINNNGWIAADGTNSVTGVTHAFLLRPSPATTPTCKPQGNFTVCTLRPTICGSNGFPFCAAACAFPGCVSSLVT